MPEQPGYYILGTKYGTPAEDMLPEMLADGVIAIGFMHDTPLPQLVGSQYHDALAELHRLFPDERRADAKTQLARFFALRPGDLIALKSSGSPVGDQPRLVIARYAVIAGNKRVSYRHANHLGHTVGVEFLDKMESIELPLGYGRTLHHVTDTDRIEQIFGAYADRESLERPSSGSTTLKSTHSSKVKSRHEYIMERVHNQLQNAFYELLRARYGDAVRLESDNIDIAVSSRGKLILVEVKSSPSPTYCIREALGQMLHYAWRGNHHFGRVCFVIVGPSIASPEDAAFLAHVRETTGLDLTYCTPETYDADAVSQE